MRFWKPLSLLVLLSLFTVFGCAPAAPSTGQVREGGVRPAVKRITAAIMGDPRTLRNTLNAAGGSGSVPGIDAVEELTNPGLATTDNRGTWVARVAEAVPSVENGLWRVLPDGRMQTTWKIREGARWHDGVSITGGDFVFTAMVGQDPELPVFRDQMYRFIESVEAPDPRTVNINWNKPFIDAVDMFNSTQTYPLPAHLLEKAFQEDKLNFTQLPFWSQEYVGTGPYRLQDWVTGTHLVLAANDQYVLGRPKIDEIEIKFIPDPNTLMANIAAGAVELTLGRSLSIEQAVQVRDQWNSGKLEAMPVNWIAMYPQFVNPNPAVVGDVRFRRAVYHSVDRKELVDSLQAGLAQVADSIIIPNEPEFQDVARSVTRYAHDPRRAGQLVESLGYTRGADGILRDPSGERLSVELRTVRHDLYEKALLSVGDYLQRVGIGFEPNIVPPPRVQDREYRATFPGFEVIENPNDFPSLVRLRLSETPLPENRFTGRNRVRYVNPEFDALLERYFTTIPMRERAQVAGQIVSHMTDQLVWMGLFHQAEPTMIANRLINVTARHEGSVQSWNAHEWDVR